MWVAYFARLFPKVTEEDITKFEKEYRFSEEERSDVVAAYESLEGSMKDILDSIMLCTDDDEDRFADIIEAALKADKVETYWNLYGNAHAERTR
jgi:DnaJ homolog subfamily C member 9